MGSKYLFWIIPFCLLLGIFMGFYFSFCVETKHMGEYDLYNCIYNNAYNNGFNQNPVMIRKIQDECVCFRENNYTNLLEVNCSK